MQPEYAWGSRSLCFPALSVWRRRSLSLLTFSGDALPTHHGWVKPLRSWHKQCKAPHAATRPRHTILPPPAARLPSVARPSAIYIHIIIIMDMICTSSVMRIIIIIVCIQFTIQYWHYDLIRLLWSWILPFAHAYWQAQARWHRRNQQRGRRGPRSCC